MEKPYWLNSTKFWIFIHLIFVVYCERFLWRICLGMEWGVGWDGNGDEWNFIRVEQSIVMWYWILGYSGEIRPTVMPDFAKLRCLYSCVMSYRTCLWDNHTNRYSGFESVKRRFFLYIRNEALFARNKGRFSVYPKNNPPFSRFSSR